jgi:hypothetical protein
MKLTHRFAELTPEKRPQDPHMDGTGLRFETMEHGGEYPDTMPQAIRVIDAEGRSCIYVPISQNGKVVDSQGYMLNDETRCLMTTLAKLIERKQKLLERLQANPGPHERDEIEGQLAQIDTALDMLDEPGESSDEQ